MASMKSGLTPENRSRCDGEAVKFMPNENIQESMESIESGFCSPPLWKNRRPSPPKSPSTSLISHHDHERISPNSRLQAIVGSQFELMELVKSMPESSYELSLTDLVENPKSEIRVPQLRGPDNDRDLRRRSLESKKSYRITRSASFENRGLLLKMVFPVGLPSKRKKSMDKNIGGRTESLKVCGERDWWKKRLTGSTDSDSSRTSGGGSGSSGCSLDSAGGATLEVWEKKWSPRELLLAIFPVQRKRIGGLVKEGSIHHPIPFVSGYSFCHTTHNLEIK